jgi:hydrogenase maturation protein HypF
MSQSVVSGHRVRHRIRVRGVVQGVGFRPYIYVLATGLGLDGHVGNDADGVFVEVEGDPRTVTAFERRLVVERPPLARIDAVEAKTVGVVGEPGFRIVESRADPTGRTFVPPDIAVCDDCLRELHDACDRRYRYPFINCTNCGPRFTITRRLPYDRPNTTMSSFELCDECAEQYHDPADRRFHAQPVACAECGPQLWFETAHAIVEGADHAIARAQHALAAGVIVAIKGLGGYHLACDAHSPSAIDRLRARKNRGDKPFAVMVRDLGTAARIASVSPGEAELLTAPQRPIVLLRRRHGALHPSVAPGNPLIGVILPYTPVHHLLFAPVPGVDAPVPDALVMTSGNLSDEPICYDDADARRRLGRIADAWLAHDRPIHVPCDDSVVRVVDGEQLPIRRSRGYAPLPVRLPFEIAPVLAVGGELKNAFCVAAGADAWMSQHIGDMGSVETLDAFEKSAQQFAEMYRIAAELIVADAHPGYQTRRWAERVGSASVALAQHHHAHVAAVMAEHGLAESERVIGFAFDGTGYGTDGAIWGGEVLVAGYDGFERIAHLRYVPLPGGDAAIRKPYRVALAHLWAIGAEWSPDLPPVGAARADELVVLRRQLERNVQCVPTSSVGRLFDAVSSLLGIRHIASYEAQAAIELESLAERHIARPRDYRFGRADGSIDPGPMLAALIADLRRGEHPGSIAAGFHLAVASVVAELAIEARDRTGLERVALSGGVFQNALLVRLTRKALAAHRFDVLTHRLVPPNDGGLALGQAAIAGRRSQLERGTVHQ